MNYSTKPFLFTSYLTTLVLVLTTGCASQTAKRVKANDYETEGIRYWLSSPYLLVNSRVVLSETQTLHYQDGDSLIRVKTCTPTANCTTDSRRTRLEQSANKSDEGKITGVPVPDPSTVNGGATGTNPPGGGSGKKPGDKPKTPSGSAGGKISIVWLPDYCEQYAYSSKSFLAKSNVSVSLADGWKLEKITADTDSTGIALKVLDLVGAVIAPTEALATEVADDEVAEPDQSGLTYWLLTETAYLNPGIYAIMSRTTCSEQASFNANAFNVTTSRVWKPLKSQ